MTDKPQDKESVDEARDALLRKALRTPPIPNDVLTERSTEDRKKSDYKAPGR